MATLSPPERQLAACVEALVITVPPIFTWFGHRALRLRPGARRHLTPESVEGLLLHLMEGHLYRHFYTLGGAQPLRRMPYQVDSGLNTAGFRQALAAANRGQGFWETGWQVIALGADGVQVRKNDLILTAPLDLCRSATGEPLSSLQPGDVIALPHPAALPAISPGFFMAVSDTPFPPVAVLRFYWNIVPRGAPILMTVVTGRLNAAGIPFRFKVLDTPSAYARADAAVLYLPRAALERAASLLNAIYRDVATLLDPGVPALTLVLAPGLGAAEDPLAGESFGISRCRLIAHGLNDAFKAGAASDQVKLDAVRQRFETAGLSTAAPHLSAESKDDWAVVLQDLGRPCPRPPSQSHTALPDLSENVAVELLDQAIWHAGRCTWIGAVNEPLSDLEQRRFAPLDGSLYSGTAGLALLFAELARANGNRRHREAALGCLRYAVERSLQDETMPAFSAYTGVIGTAWVAALLARLLASDEAAASAVKLLAWLSTRHDDSPEVDFLTGAAGSLLALLSLDRLGFATETAPLVEACAGKIFASARRHGPHWTWPAPDAPKRPPLTGLSHGAAGIAAALAVLYRYSSDTRYREAAYGALSYERTCFDPVQANWPDFRDMDKVKTARRQAPCTSYWCHGAPGIALGRAATAQALEDPALLAEAYIAWDTTARWVDVTLGSSSESHCLCHGLPGNTLVLASGLSEIPEPPLAWRSAYDEALLSLIEAYSTGSPGLRRNLYDSGAVGLMLGAGGLAYFFLASSQPEVTSVLTLREAGGL